MPKHLRVPRTPRAAPAHAGRRIVNVQQESTVNDVINSALGIIKSQVDNLSAKSRMGGSLLDIDVKNLRTYIQSLVELSREERERTKHDGVEDWLSELSPDELIEMAQGRLGQSLGMNNALDTTATTVPDNVPEDVKE